MGGMEYLLNINNLVLTCLNKYPYEFPVFLSSPYDEKDIVTISDSERAAATASSSNSEQQQQRAAATVSSSNSEQQQQRQQRAKTATKHARDPQIFLSWEVFYLIYTE